MTGLVAWKPTAPMPELASVRLRCLRPIEHLRRAGWRCELFDSAHASAYRLVVFQKAYASEDLALVDDLRARGVRTVFDLCDNHFYNPSGRRDYAERAERLRRMIDAVDAVTVSTPELGRIVDRPSAVVDDALDAMPAPGMIEGMRRWMPRRRIPLRVVWFGNAGLEDPAFGLIDLARIASALEELNRRRPIVLTVISNSRPTFDHHLAGVRFPARYEEWEAGRFQRRVRAHDLCVVPISPNPFTRCKTVNRLATALLLGVPTAADLIPSYEELRPYALFDEWGDGLAAYAEDQPRQRRHVRAGKAYLEGKYTPARVVAQWSSVLTPLLA